jgi:hypothetical protein
MTNGYESRGESQSAWLVNTPPRPKYSTSTRSRSPACYYLATELETFDLELLIKQIERLLAESGTNDTYIIRGRIAHLKHEGEEELLDQRQRHIYN